MTTRRSTVLEAIRGLLLPEREDTSNLGQIHTIIEYHYRGTVQILDKSKEEVPDMSVAEAKMDIDEEFISGDDSNLGQI